MAAYDSRATESWLSLAQDDSEEGVGSEPTY
jgi:hypothetical protein